ncbi:MAG: PdxA family dehydrogenase, partial [Chthoniobacterales bacterium]
MKRIGITLGDAAGIGPEIVQAALASPDLPRDFEYVVIGDYPECVAGKPTPETARAAAAALEDAAKQALDGRIAAVVTGPIHKARMYEIGFQFPGQTEFFAARAGVQNFAMMLTGGSLTVALVTTHIPLRDVPGALRKDEIVRVGLLLEAFVRQRKSRAPRIAVAGLNPHAGESGTIGREEIEVISPAIADLNRRLNVFTGPLSPDTVFHHAAAR